MGLASATMLTHLDLSKNTHLRLTADDIDRLLSNLPHLRQLVLHNSHRPPIDIRLACQHAAKLMRLRDD